MDNETEGLNLDPNLPRSAVENGVNNLAGSDANKEQPVEELKEVLFNRDAFKKVIIYGVTYFVVYVPKSKIYPFFGYAEWNTAYVRDDLPPRVKNFVEAHELFHLQDNSNFGGWIGRELRANLIPGLKDPLGLLATIWMTISDKDRIKLYLERIRVGR